MKAKLIIIEGKQIGIAGLDDVLEKFIQEGREPDEAAKDQILRELKQLNYIPLSKEKIYAAAFLKEYERFRQSKAARTAQKDLGTWQGIPREEVPWYPTILEDFCDGCMVCLEFCSFGVYEYDEKSNKVKVANPFNCQVGCSMCAVKCKPKAISFPPVKILEAFRKR
jgi:NAD-dependent dihydropyrimidine dehydrogenase PreA subunit